MAHGHEDFDRGVSLDAQEIAELAVDIVAQSVGNMAIDVAAQTISDMDIDVVAQSIAHQDTSMVLQPSKAVKFVNADQTATVSAYGQQDTYIRAAAGTIWRVRGIYLLVGYPTGATSGDHTFRIQSESRFIKVLRGRANYDARLRFANGYWSDANLLQEPDTSAAQAQMVDYPVLDENNGIQIRYDNDTDADQTGTRNIRIWAEETKIA